MSSKGSKLKLTQGDPPLTVWDKVKPHFQIGGVGLVAIAFLLAIAISIPINIAMESNMPADVPKLVGLPGMLWLRTLKAVVMPLIVASMVLSIFRLRDNEAAGSKMAGYVLTYYICSTFVAVAVGFLAGFGFLSQLIEPIPRSRLERLEEIGSEDGLSADDLPPLTLADQFVKTFEQLIPENVVGSMASDQLLAVAIASVAMGALLPRPTPGEGSFCSIVKTMEEIEHVVGKIIRFVIKLAPVGVFFLLFSSLVVIDLGDIMRLLGVNIAVQIGMLIFMFLVVHPAIYFILTRDNPYKYFGTILPVPITALGTASSAATLPVSFRTAKSLGIPDTVAKFSLPLGMTINTDGAACVYTCTTLWIAFSQSHDLGIGNLLTIATLCTLGAIGSSPIPNAGIALILLICQQVNIPASGFFPLVLASDLILDRILTAVNTTGDMWVLLAVTRMLRVKCGMTFDEESQDAGKLSPTESSVRRRPTTDRLDSQ